MGVNWKMPTIISDQPTSLFSPAGFRFGLHLLPRRSWMAETSLHSATRLLLLFSFHRRNFRLPRPAFAGIMALSITINPLMVEMRGQELPTTRYMLCKKAGSSCPSVRDPATTCVFNDIAARENIGPDRFCWHDFGFLAKWAPNCSAVRVANNNGVLVDPAKTSNEAWLGGTGYDMATGLGSVTPITLLLIGERSRPLARQDFDVDSTTGITHGTENVFCLFDGHTGIRKHETTGSISLIATMADGSTLGLDTFALPMAR